MSESTATAGHAPAGKPAMSVFERFLTFWVALCIIVGIAFGQLPVLHLISDATVAQLNLPVAVLVWRMIVPMLLKIDLAALREVGQVARHRHDRRHQLADQDILDGALGLDVRRASLSAMAASGSGEQLYGGLILLAAAPCTAMVFAWSNLVDGEPHFTLSQVALNDPS
jgi:ACR3 family arsenite transporter